jgi:hypothetical protein
MNPTLALLFGMALIAWMLERDRRWRSLSSGASWIPAIFLTIASSHQLSWWLYQLGLMGPQTSRVEGSPINAVFNGSLIVAGILVLGRRGFNWLELVWSNKALFAMYAFFFCSVLWSPFPVPTVKRVLQDFACVVAALVLLTERNPDTAIRVVFVRLSYILFPLSVVFIRWFPDIGRVQSEASGLYMPAGVTLHKNELGQLAIVFCVVLLWDLLQTRHHSTTSRVAPDRLVRIVSLAIGFYLLVLSSSATAWVGAAISLPLLLLGKNLAKRKDAKRVFVAATLSLALLVPFVLAYASSFSEAMNRGEGLSGRTDIWRVTLEEFGDRYGVSMIGAGYRSFWDSSVGESVWRQLGLNPLTQSHNGYLETYLNGGFVGVILLSALVIGFGWSAADKLVSGDPLGRLAVVFWPLLLFVNVTEAQFFQVGPLWFTTLLVVMNGPWGRRRSRSERVRSVPAGRTHVTRVWQHGAHHGGRDPIAPRFVRAPHALTTPHGSNQGM